MKVTKAKVKMPKIMGLCQAKPGDVVRFVNGDVLYLVGDISNSTLVSISELPSFLRVHLTNLETGSVSAPLADTQVVRVKLECKLIGDEQ